MPALAMMPTEAWVKLYLLLSILATVGAFGIRQLRARGGACEDRGRFRPLSAVTLILGPVIGAVIGIGAIFTRAIETDPGIGWSFIAATVTYSIVASLIVAVAIAIIVDIPAYRRWVCARDERGSAIAKLG